MEDRAAREAASGYGNVIDLTEDATSHTSQAALGQSTSDVGFSITGSNATVPLRGPPTGAPTAATSSSSSNKGPVPRAGGYKPTAQPRVQMIETLARTPLVPQQANGSTVPRGAEGIASDAPKHSRIDLASEAARRAMEHIRTQVLGRPASNSQPQSTPWYSMGEPSAATAGEQLAEDASGQQMTASQRDEYLQKSINAMIDQATELGDIDMSQAEVKGLKCKLMPHQVQGHNWLKLREEAEFAGGILADDMGLGKTVQMLALVVSAREAERAIKQEGSKTVETESAVIVPPAKTKAVQVKSTIKGVKTSHELAMAEAKNSRSTLIVAPLAVVKQWESEAKEKTEGLRTLIHHGPSRTKHAIDFAGYDIVITTYTTMGAEYENFEGNEGRGKPKAVKKKGGAAQEAANKDSDSTESASSSSASDSEDDGRAPRKNAAKPRKAPGARSVKKAAPLFYHTWRRIVLDEAQHIKNRNARCSKAAFQLSTRAHSKWALTGTPIQNDAYEMFSLIHFLQIPPFDNFQHFKEKIGEPVKSSNQNRVNWGIKRLQVVLQTIMLRRTKDVAGLDGKPIIPLPDRHIDVISSSFDDEEEQKFYQRLQAKMKDDFSEDNQASDAKFDHMGALVALLRLRQACNHPALCSKKVAADAVQPAPTAKDAGQGEESEAEDADALADLMSGLAVERKCEMCRETLLPGASSGKLCGACDDAVKEQQRRGVTWTEGGVGSTKIRMMLGILDNIKRSTSATGTEKTIIFSQFTSFLDLVEPFLKQNRHKFVRYDGSMKPAEREGNLHSLKTDPTVTVALISFKAGSTGLNLTCCNHVVLCDLWWNPALEMQAFDRAWRFGQTKDVKVYKLVIKDTVEQRILVLQDAKRQISSAALEGSKLKKGGNKLSRKELFYLFSGSDVA
ncbi:Helicase-like transcription factor HLTF/DNA helicase RAD5, DEAD-box superfamily [Ceraceosorus bombacis]|uniref:Helicase-like transcription factor HLTF/DNA helicase RAD5, DEAD-box superfamily n=1 Tax=Ceraceosorus bombacis TaxID=401625 RepID=A0A0P1B8Q8_9BASI|nr:Helicase-like transcription factor HLTF/DNA helicase RAD5, DEAD-box superfamily [Ceraceosorus bombacis]